MRKNGAAIQGRAKRSREYPTPTCHRAVTMENVASTVVACVAARPRSGSMGTTCVKTAVMQPAPTPIATRISQNVEVLTASLNVTPHTADATVPSAAASVLASPMSSVACSSFLTRGGSRNSKTSTGSAMSAMVRPRPR